jgi:molybdopterin-binding protein
MKISARNVLRGKVKEVTKGAVNAEVKVDIGGGLVLVSVITNSSVETLNLKAGSEVYAVIKASNVMIATD